jgi:uncharacterized protein (DUF3820 family)
MPTPDPQLLRELVRYEMPFGKYKGRRLYQLPEPYLVWFQRKGFPAGKLGMLLETALVIRQNGLEELLPPLIQSEARKT